MKTENLLEKAEKSVIYAPTEVIPSVNNPRTYICENVIFFYENIIEVGS